MLIDIRFIIQILTAFQFLFFAGFLFTNKNGKRISNNLLAAFLLSKGLTITVNLIAVYYYKSLTPSSLSILYLGSSILFFYPPILYLYTKSLTEKEFGRLRNYKLLFIPFAFALFLKSFQYLLYLGVFDNSYLAHFKAYRFYTWLSFNSLYYIVAISFSIASLVLIKRYQKNLKDKFSSIEKINLNWLFVLHFGFLSIWIVYMLDFGLGFAKLSNPTISNSLSLLGLVLLFVFSNIIVFKGLKFPQLFSGLEKEASEKTLDLPKSLDVIKIIENLNTIMKEEKLYLDSGLTLEKLAYDVEINPRHLTKILKSEFNSNFYDYINDLRIKETEDRLIKTSNADKTILEIMYESGFNSKSVFNSVFKKKTRLTPSEYRKKFQPKELSLQET